MTKTRKLYDEKQDSSINRENGFQPYYCWFLDEPRESPLYYARFLSPDHANTAAACWDRLKTQEQCEGFSNKETWAVAYHLDNTQWMQSLYRSHRASARHYGVSIFQGQIKSMVEGWHEDFYSGDTKHFGAKELKDIRLMLGDIGSLWRVNWKELAEHLMKD